MKRLDSISLIVLITLGLVFLLYLLTKVFSISISFVLLSVTGMIVGIVRKNNKIRNLSLVLLALTIVGTAGFFFLLANSPM